MDKMGSDKESFYGWPLVGVGFLVYGFGIAPAYYSWGFFAPEVIAELGLSRQQIGEIFGAFTLVYSVASLAAAGAIRRWGLRATMSAGALLAAMGFWRVASADGVADFYLGYSLIGGIGIGFSTILAGQTLAVHWFRRYRARAIAIVMLGAAVVGAAVTPVDDLILRHWNWRAGWMLISGISALVALLAAVFIRNRPEELGQRRDGERADEDSQSLNSLGGSLNSLDGSLNSLDGSPDGLEAGGLATARFSVRRALLTLQFFVATSAVLANAVSWRVLTVHGRLHLENLGFTTTVAAAILGVRVGVSAVGRLSGALGDFIAPTRVFSLALVVHACGITGLAYAETMPVAYLCVATIGVGYGAGYISGPVVFADFFGRDAFVGTSSLRIALVGLVGFVGPSWAGAAADRSGSYTSTLLVLSAICLVAAVAIFACRRPALVEAPASAST